MALHEVEENWGGAVIGRGWEASGEKYKLTEVDKHSTVVSLPSPLLSLIALQRQLIERGHRKYSIVETVDLFLAYNLRVARSSIFRQVYVAAIGNGYRYEQNHNSLSLKSEHCLNIRILPVSIGFPRQLNAPNVFNGYLRVGAIQKVRQARGGPSRCDSL